MSASQRKRFNIPKNILQEGLTRGFIYHGKSMKPTFQAGQLLYVRPGTRNIKPGDVVVYRGERGHIVHRVVSIGAAGYITRGDNNHFIDAIPVDVSQVIGRVEMAAHQDGIQLVWGGWRGWWMVHLRWALRWMERRLRIIFGWSYRWLKASRLMIWIWKPVITRVYLQTNIGPMVKYIYKKKTVAIWEANLGRFECRKPFDLVIPSPVEKIKISS